MGKYLIAIEAKGRSTEFGGTPWEFKVGEWTFEKDDGK